MSAFGTSGCQTRPGDFAPDIVTIFCICFFCQHFFYFFSDGVGNTEVIF